MVLSEDLARNLGFTPSTAIGQPLDISITSRHVYSEAALVDSATIPVVVDAVASWSSPGDSTDFLLVLDGSNLDAWSTNQILLYARVSPRDVRFVEQLSRLWLGAQQHQFTEIRVERVDELDDFVPVLDQVRTTGAFVSGIALAIGGLGILEVGLASVRERSQEFGLRRAIGSSTPRVLLSVLCQTLIESILVIFIALPLAFLVLQLVVARAMPPKLPAAGIVLLPISSTMVGIVATIVVSLVASLAPAIRAARLSVVNALRN